MADIVKQKGRPHPKKEAGIIYTCAFECARASLQFLIYSLSARSSRTTRTTACTACGSIKPSPAMGLINFNWYNMHVPQLKRLQTRMACTCMCVEARRPRRTATRYAQRPAWTPLWNRSGTRCRRCLTSPASGPARGGRATWTAATRSAPRRSRQRKKVKGIRRRVACAWSIMHARSKHYFAH